MGFSISVSDSVWGRACCGPRAGNPWSKDTGSSGEPWKPFFYDTPSKQVLASDQFRLISCWQFSLHTFLSNAALMQFFSPTWSSRNAQMNHSKILLIYRAFPALLPLSTGWRNDLRLKVLARRQLLFLIAPAVNSGAAKPLSQPSHVQTWGHDETFGLHAGRRRSLPPCCQS